MPSPLDITIKHAGKSYPITLDLDQPGSHLKQQIFERTGVEPSKVKVVVKGSMLKDDADLKKLGFKAGQTIMVIGAAGPLPPPPSEKIVFMEDMTDIELAQAVATPVGLQNLGNTCYMNSTVQVLRAIPELQSALDAHPGSSSSGASESSLTASLRDLYKNMSSTQEDFPPVVFLQMLRQFAPQFAEISRSGGGGFAQQDAQEAWASIVQAVKTSLGSGGSGFVDQYMMGEMTKTLKSPDAPDEEPTVSKERFLEVKCPISASTTYMMTGINDSLNQDIEKTSPTLSRQAIYHETSRISRLPSYLTVNFVRFYWRREIGKKTKIMKRVSFPHDLDVMDLLTDELKCKVKGVNDKLKEVDKDRRERAKVRRRAKRVEEAIKAPTPSTTAAPANPSDDPPEAMAVDEAASSSTTKAGELVDEKSKRLEEAQLLNLLVDPALKADTGANVSGLYELVGVVSHKGASADGGHYVGWTRADAMDRKNKGKGKAETELDVEDPDKVEWYKFDDEKVTTVAKEKITLLEGGGEDHSAYILIYRSKSLE
ncbi:BQ2448_7078 [Microbotryum intermedium]|uniref:Ubiquitin carboxyl-terminal hydrolase n=1 Tax=Microbotryum intermedium TaxID=269621 RepID=A0A238FMB1_9BASI|nr:BQ2448_7078 [Microbotryum intermedium]